MTQRLSDKFMDEILADHRANGPFPKGCVLAIHPMTERLLFVEAREDARAGIDVAAIALGAGSVFGFAFVLDQLVAVNALEVRRPVAVQG